MKEKKKFQRPPMGCILLSAALIGAGCLEFYLTQFRGFQFSRRYDEIFWIILILGGCLVFYRGMQGKEFRFWHEKWEPLGEADGDILAPKKAEEFICPHCQNKLTKKEEYCPICGRNL